MTQPGGAAFAEVRAREFRWSSAAVYLNAASYGPLPECALSAVEQFDRRRQRGKLADPDFSKTHEDARASVARLIGAHIEQIALVPNTNVGVNIGAQLVHLLAPRGRRRILVSEREFPANVYPWLALERHGFIVQFVPTLPGGDPDEEAIRELLLQPDVAALAISFVQFATGYRADLKRLGALCRAHGVFFVVDAIQGIGVVPLNVPECGIDVLAAGAQKWLCSPFGTGFTYIRPELCQNAEPYLPGWLSFTAFDDFTRLTEYRYELHDDATRFEVGTRPFQSCAGMAESLDLLLSLGLDRIREHVLGLQQQLLDWADRNEQVRVTSSRVPSSRSGIVCLRPPNAVTAHAALLKAGVTCSLREGSIRISPHFYNDQQDIARVLAVLEEVVAA